MDRTLNLSDLYELLHNTLLITEEVKEILRRDCDEAAFVLKPWQVKTVVEKRIDENLCNCRKNDEVEEIAAGIGRAIILAQELREKLKLNVTSKKKALRKDTVENIYLSNSASISDRKKISKSNITTQKANTTKRSDCKRSSAFQNDKVISVMTKKSVGGTKRSNAIDEMQSKASPAKVAGKPKKGKNFILENKLNVKKISSANKLQIGDSNPKDIPQNSLQSEASTTELSDLIRKIARQSTESASISFPDNIKNDCPLHGNNAQSVQEQIVAIDVVEALRHFNVPNEIVKVLRTYHAFLKTETDNLNDIKKDRYTKSVDTFLNEFEAMNIAMQNYLLEESHLLNKTAKSITAFSNIFNEDLDSIQQSNDMKIASTELEVSLKQYDIKNIAKAVIKTPYNLSLSRGWMSNSIWNISCMEHFENFSKAYNIRYCNKKQLLSLYEAIQKLQRTKYLNTLIEIVLYDVIPTIKSNIKPTSAEYVQAYKTMFILYQGLNPEVPVLLSLYTMDAEYAYTKKRMHFGKKCNFSDCDKTEVEIKSNPALMSNYVRMDPVTHATQCSKVYAVHEVNTTTATYKENKMFHYEGGWPKDINMKDVEQTVRYRRKIEKDELYTHTMLQLLPSMEHCILQNNACNIYEQYFADVETVPLIQRAFSRTVNVYRDPLTMKRQITHLSWSPDQGNRFAASYCNVDLKKTFSSNYTSYIWEVENPNNPYITLKSFCPTLTLEYSPKDSNTLVGGLITGQVACWDIRRGPEVVDTSSVKFSHRDSCDKTLWINSKTGTEFFSASKDGQIKWWDTRKMQVPTDTLVIDLLKPENQNVDKATGISALQFEPSMGTRFMCGLENGIVISGNRKGKTPAEKIATRFRAQYGPVISVERNPTFVKNFLTVGDWTSRIWSEDCRESCIAWTPGHRDFLTGGVWSATRYSVYYLIKVDGTLDVWDFLIQQDSPVLSIKVCDESLTCLRPHEQGQLAAVANKKGSTYLLEFSEALTINQKNDKLLLTTLFDRETRREKVIEAKNREQRLKMRTLKMHGESDFTETASKSDEPEDSKESSGGLKNTLIMQCEQEYENMINAELTRQAEAVTVELNNNVMQNGAIIS